MKEMLGGRKIKANISSGKKTFRKKRVENETDVNEHERGGGGGMICTIYDFEANARISIYISLQQTTNTELKQTS